MSTRDLSVIMAAHDTELFIGEAITSVLERADRLLELIVVDDGSTDGTAAVAAAFGEPVRVIRQENRGAAGARNTGLAAARGAFIGFLDSDDLWVAGHPDPRLAALDGDPGLAGVFGNARFFVAAGDEAPEAVLDTVTASQLGTLILRRAVFDTVGTFNEAFDLAEDMDLISRIREAGLSLANLDTRVLLVRLRPGSLTRDREAVLHGWMQAGRAAMRRQREREGSEG